MENKERDWGEHIEEMTNEEEDAIMREIWHGANLLCSDKCSYCQKVKDENKERKDGN